MIFISSWASEKKKVILRVFIKNLDTRNAGSVTISGPTRISVAQSRRILRWQLSKFIFFTILQLKMRWASSIFRDQVNVIIQKWKKWLNKSWLQVYLITITSLYLPISYKLVIVSLSWLFPSELHLAIVFFILQWNKLITTSFSKLREWFINSQFWLIEFFTPCQKLTSIH